MVSQCKLNSNAFSMLINCFPAPYEINNQPNSNLTSLLNFWLHTLRSNANALTSHLSLCSEVL